jgi:hypothetical protein
VWLADLGNPQCAGSKKKGSFEDGEIGEETITVY